jgi:hypothetical protein
MPLAVAELAGRPPFRPRIVKPALLVPPRPELAPVLLASWTEPMEVPRQDLPPRWPEPPLTSLALE